MEEKDISLRIATLRTKKNVSAREMSLAIGQNPNYINHIENGSATPSLSGLSYICEYFGITMSEFFDFDATNPLKSNKIIEYLKRLDDEQLDIVEKLVKNLVKK
ncbi:MAG: helix-turn-helix transcriptional regulator [Clostridia bacterium]|nr:helix-turn-helix transcriptional regulator [Clostridia bacterium]